MALVVSTAPPDLVVKTKVKKVRMPADESPFLCDHFWACVLDDYLEDEDSDDGILETQSRDDNVSKSRTGRNKKHGRKNTNREILKKLSQEPDHVSMGGELENLLSDDHETDHREKVADHPRSNDKLDALQEEGEEKEAFQEYGQGDVAEENTKHKKKPKKRVQSAPPEFELAARLQQSIPRSQDYGPEQETSVPKADLRTKSSEVFHYAPLMSYTDEVTQNPKVKHDRGNQFTEPATGLRRVPVDPDAEAKGREPRPRRPNERTRASRYAEILHSTPSAVSRSALSQPFHVRSAVSNNERSSRSQRRSDARIETIDLTSEPFHNALTRGATDERQKYAKADVYGNLMTKDDTLKFLLTESTRAESDYRRRKLDRKEALNRIRAIKARLQSS